MLRFLNISWLKNTLFLTILAGVIALTVYVAEYPVKLQQGGTRLYLNTGKVILVIPGVYDQYRVFNNTLSFEFLFGLDDTYISLDGMPYILNRPSPDTISYDGQDYFFAKDLTKIQIAPQISDFSYIDNVAIFGKETEFGLLQNEIQAYGQNKLQLRYDCSNDQLSRCKDYLSSATLETRFVDNATLQIDYTYELKPGIDPTQIQPIPSYNIPKEFKYCDERGCVSPQLQDNPIDDVDQMPVEFFRDKLLVDRKILKDLRLDAINYNKLSLPDLPAEFSEGVYEYPKPAQTYIKYSNSKHQIAFNIIPPESVNKITVDYKYSKLKFHAGPCQSNPCRLSFKYQIAHN
jgi:hypothetical protein